MARVLIGIVLTLLVGGCATTATVPSSAPPVDGPRLAARGLFELDAAGEPTSRVEKNADSYYTQVGKRYRLAADVQVGGPKIVRLHRRYEWWTRSATSDGLMVAFDYADDLRHISDCCTSIWGAWLPERDTFELYYLKIILWVVDERGRTSNSVTFEPVVVGSPGVPYMWW